MGEIEEGLKADSGSSVKSVDNGLCGRFKGRGGFLL
jgi:hypothetical protein